MGRWRENAEGSKGKHKHEASGFRVSLIKFTKLSPGLSYRRSFQRQSTPSQAAFHILCWFKVFEIVFGYNILGAAMATTRRRLKEFMRSRRVYRRDERRRKGGREQTSIKLIIPLVPLVSGGDKALSVNRFCGRLELSLLRRRFPSQSHTAKWKM